MLETAKPGLTVALQSVNRAGFNDGTERFPDGLGQLILYTVPDCLSSSWNLVWI